MSLKILRSAGSIFLAFVYTALLAVVMSRGAQAQTGAASEGSATDNSSQLGEITVTAQRREQNLQDVPVSVNVVSGLQFETEQITDITSLAEITPGVNVVSVFSLSEIRVGIRGMSELNPALGTDPAVGVYVDGVYYQTNAGMNLGMVDMQRVETLYGPQGTLFGRNTIGGALSITTQKPKDYFEASATANVGNFNEYGFNGVVNLPLSDELAVRIVYDHDQHSGYGTNTFLGTQLNDLNQNYLRASIKAKPADGLELDLTAFYNRSEAHPLDTYPGYVDTTSPINSLIPSLQGHPGDLLSNYVGGPHYDNEGGRDADGETDVYGFTGTLTEKLDAATVKFISAYTNTYYNFLNTSGVPYDTFTILSLPTSVNQLSEEFQVFGDALDNRLQWISGLYYFHEQGSQLAQFVIVPPVAMPLGTDSADGATISNSSYAAYAQASYAILPELRLTGGVRYTVDDRQSVYHSHLEDSATRAFLTCTLGITGATDYSSCMADYTAAFHYVPWTVGLDLKPNSDQLFYAKVSQGYRSGGTSETGPTATNYSVFGFVQPESLLSPEIGSKLDFLSHRLRVDTAVYYSDYKNIQQSALVASPFGVTSVLRNVGQANIWGGELTAVAKIAQLTLQAGLAVVDPKYTAGPSLGQPFINNSKTSWSLLADYPITVTGGVLRLDADYSWRSTQYLWPPTPGNPGQNAAVTQGSYGLLNSRLSFEFANVPMTVALWGKNLTNKYYVVSVADLSSALGFTNDSGGIPRTFGATVNWRFGHP
jgi:iron complex outermembrane recepter protein